MKSATVNCRKALKRTCENDHTFIRRKKEKKTFWRLWRHSPWFFFSFYSTWISSPFFSISTAAFNLTHHCTSCSTWSAHLRSASWARGCSPPLNKSRNPQYLGFIFQDVGTKWCLPTASVFLFNNHICCPTSARVHAESKRKIPRRRGK